MKKTLFLAAVLGSLTPFVHAELMDGVARPAQNGTWVWTEVTINESNQDRYLGKTENDKEVFDNSKAGCVNIGVAQGEGYLTIDGVDLKTANGVFVGGHGWQNPDTSAKGGNNGTIKVTNGGSLSVAGIPGNTAAGGANLALANSDDCVTGTIIVENGGKLHANSNTAIGGGNSIGVLTVTGSGSVADFDVFGTTPASTVQIQMGIGQGSTGMMNITDGGTVSLKDASAPVYFFAGSASFVNGAQAEPGGKAVINVQGNSKLELAEAGKGYNLLGYAQDAQAYLNVTDHSTVTGGSVYVGYYGAGQMTVDSTSSVELTSALYVGAGSLDCGVTNEGNITAGSVALYNQAEMHNTGTLTVTDGDLTLSSYALLQTGVMTVTNRETPINDGTQEEIGHSYDTGLVFQKEGAGVKTSGTYPVFVGALIEGEEGTTQYLYKEDRATLQQAVIDGLGLTGQTVGAINSFGKGISSVYTTDEVNDVAPTESVILSGGTAVIEKGDNSDTLDGTIGSYKTDILETEANIALDEGAKDSQVRWGGDTLKTVKNEATSLNSKTTVSMTGNGTLVVVEKSTLSNNGTINGDVEVYGTLKGAGTTLGHVEVTGGGRLVVGNSPGLATYGGMDGGLEVNGTLEFCVDGLDTAATETASGWGSETYSQLQMNGGTLTFGSNGKIVISFGGDSIFNANNYYVTTEFSMTLITGIADESLDTLVALCDNGSLLDRTSFVLTDELFGIPEYSDSPWPSVTDAVYSVEGNSLKLSGKFTMVPEPATATLSLLALAALSARRRRKTK